MTRAKAGAILPGGASRDEGDILGGPMTPFVPAADFDGYPDGKTKTAYHADVTAEAPANYVEHLRSKGLVAG